LVFSVGSFPLCSSIFNDVSYLILQDQFDNIGSHTQKGIDFADKYREFLKERCAIESDYAAKLK
jgi:hypothetical protein